MYNFFKYDDMLVNREFYHNLTFLERIVPFIVLYSLIALIFVYKNTILESTFIDLILRVTVGVLLSIFYVSHYILLWIYNGFNIYNLPLQLCAIAMILALIFLITKSRKIHAFLLQMGVLGGIIAMAVPLAGYSYKYYRYYQFMGSHILLVLIPIYYMVIYQYKPNFKTVVKVLIVTEILYVSMTIFNTFFDTNYFYVTLSEKTVTDTSMLNNFGGIPWYVLNVNVLGVGVYFLWYFIMQYLFNKKNQVEESSVLTNSICNRNN